MAVKDLDESSWCRLLCYKSLLEFCVPIFVMISGALFLSPGKSVTFDKVIKKYVKRIVYALVVFAFPMCTAETLFTQSGGLICSITNWITGKSWDYMSYLYMLIGLYLLTPIIKFYANHQVLGMVRLC